MITRVKFRWALATLLLIGLPVHAAQIAVQCGKVCVITIGGAIVDGDDQAFHQVAAAQSGGQSGAQSGAQSGTIVAMAGPGGKVAPALAIGNEIRARGWRTVVPADASCASACSLIWLAGTQRLLGPNARIGFHALSLAQPGVAPAETHAFDANLVHYLTALGYAYDVTATIVNTPSAMVHWRDALELNANGIATQEYRQASR